MQKINLRDLYPDVYKTDVFMDVAEEVLAAIRGQQQDDAAYERRKFRHKAHYSLNREDGIENDALNRPLTPEEILEQKQLREEVYAALMRRWRRSPGSRVLTAAACGRASGAG